MPDSTPGRPLITFVQAYVPAYRVPFFDELSRQLAGEGIDLAVAHGEPQGSQAARGDARCGQWSVPIHPRQVTMRGHAVSYRPVLSLARKSSVVVAELASTNLDTYLLALNRRVPLMLWGHGRAYVTEPSAVDARLELWLARRARRVFLYTQGGADYLRGRGYDAGRITVVRNSTDTVVLRAAAAALTEHDVELFRQQNDIRDGPVISFVGSYDDSKGLPLLIETADLLVQHLPGLRLLVAGAGPLQRVVDSAAAKRPFLHSLARADTATLARIGAVSDCFVIPGRVGLVAVDALAMGVPVATTTYRNHAPEYEYLDDSVKIVAEEGAGDLATRVLAFLSDPVRVRAASDAAYQLGLTFSIESMAAAFSTCLVQAVRHH